MKKKIAVLLCMTLMMTLVACGSKSNASEETNNGGETTESVSVDATDCEDLLTKVWEVYPEADRFPIGGGDYANMVSDSVGSFDVSRTDDLDTLLAMPADGAALIDDAASMMHMMNANTFTAGAYHLKSANDMQVLADAYKENILNRQWMCGFPEKLLIVSIGDEYMVSAFGEGTLMENFKAALMERYEMTEIIYEENLFE